MKLSGEIALASGFIFDYSNMINTDTITPAVIETLESKAKDAADALLLIREQGMAKAHLSKMVRRSMCFLRNCLSLRMAILIRRSLLLN